MVARRKPAAKKSGAVSWPSAEALNVLACPDPWEPDQHPVAALRALYDAHGRDDALMLQAANSPAIRWWLGELTESELTEYVAGRRQVYAELLDYCTSIGDDDWRGFYEGALASLEAWVNSRVEP